MIWWTRACVIGVALPAPGRLPAAPLRPNSRTRHGPFVRKARAKVSEFGIHLRDLCRRSKVCEKRGADPDSGEGAPWHAAQPRAA